MSLVLQIQIFRYDNDSLFSYKLKNNKCPQTLKIMSGMKIATVFFDRQKTAFLVYSKRYLRDNP